MKIKDLTKADYEFLRLAAKPDRTISTGFSGDEGAEELQLFYHGSERSGIQETIVVPCGEAENAAPYKLSGRLTAMEVRREYRRAINKA